MNQTNRFSYGPIKNSGETDEQHIALWVDGKPSLTVLPGQEIIRQYEVESGFLLLTDYDSPYEEITHAVLLDKSFQIVCSRQIGHNFMPWTTFLLDGTEWLDPGRLLVHSSTTHSSFEIRIRSRGLARIWPRLSIRKVAASANRQS